MKHSNMMVVHLLLTTRENNLRVHKKKANNRKELIVASFAKTSFDHPYHTQPFILSENTPKIPSVSNLFLKFNNLNYWLF